MTLRDKIADYINTEAMSHTADEQADAILSIITESVPDLEWHTREDGSMSCAGKFETTNNGGKRYPWRLTRASYPGPSYIADAKDKDVLIAAANSDNRASILSALGLSTPEQEAQGDE